MCLDVCVCVCVLTTLPTELAQLAVPPEMQRPRLALVGKVREVVLRAGSLQIKIVLTEVPREDGLLLLGVQIAELR